MKGREEPGPNRRKFLKLAGAFVGTSVLLDGLNDNFLSATEEKDVLERQKILDDFIATAQKNLRDPAVLDALEGRGEDPLSIILQAINKIPIPPKLLEGTAYDVSKLQPYCNQFNFPYGLANFAYYQNGETIISAAHPRYGEQRKNVTYPVANIDVDIWRPGPESGLGTKDVSKIIQDDPSITDSDIHGQFIVVVGKDKDKDKGPSQASDGRGYKTYAAIAIKITTGLAQKLGFGAIEEGSFLLILPPSESEPDTDATGNVARDEKGRTIKRANAMSGAQMWVYRNGEYVHAGVFFGVLPSDDKEGRARPGVNIGYARGKDDVRRVDKIKAQMSYV